MGAETFRGTPVEIDGTERRFRYTLGSLIHFEEKTGVSLMSGNDLDIEALGLKGIVTLIYAGLRHEDKDLTEDDVADMIDVSSLHALMPSLHAALRASMPEPSEEGGESGGAKTEILQAGTISGQSGE